jgi:phosphoribosylaminoimidazolecarboxamide formyltransferase/IMP cyclohydrolase
LDKIGFAESLNLDLEKVKDLRYGENPHQKAAFYRYKNKTPEGIVASKQLWGKELSFNNLLDLDSAVMLVKEFERPAAVIIKHNNPCGVAEANTLLQAFKDAWRCDPLSSFGSIISFNRKVDKEVAQAIDKSGFIECVISPGFEKKALEILTKKKNLRIMELENMNFLEDIDFKKVSGGVLLQDKDVETCDLEKLKVVTKKRPTKKELDSLLFAFKVVKHVKSNAIVLVKGSKTVGIGAGQMSRVDSVFIAVKKAGKYSNGAVCASDAFFPKEDAVRELAKAGIKAIIQPGGSISDKQIINLADRYGLSMVFSGIRHFKH